MTKRELKEIAITAAIAATASALASSLASALVTYLILRAQERKLAEEDARQRAEDIRLQALDEQALAEIQAVANQAQQNSFLNIWGQKLQE